MITQQDRTSVHSWVLDAPHLRKRVSKNRRFPKNAKSSVLQSVDAHDARCAVGIDLELVKRFMANDAAAGDQLHEMCAAKLYRAAFAVLRNKQDAEDAVQDCWLRAYANVKSFQGRSSFSTWLTRIVINSALMILRKKRNEWEISGRDDDELMEDSLSHQLLDRSQNPEEICAEQEQKNLLHAAVSTLRPRLRIAVQMGQLRGRSMKEAARILGISLTTVKARAYQARKVLRKSSVLNAIFRKTSKLAA